MGPWCNATPPEERVISVSEMSGRQGTKPQVSGVEREEGRRERFSRRPSRGGS